MKRKEFKPGTSAKVCSDHFTSEHYEIGLKYKTLKPDAIPIVFTSAKQRLRLMSPAEIEHYRSHMAILFYEQCCKVLKYL